MSPDSPSAPTHPAASPAAAPKPKRRLGRILLVVGGACVVAWLAHVVVHLWYYEETDDAFVAGHIHQISAQISGPVKAVLVQDNQDVAAGAPLVQIDPLEFQLASLKAKAGSLEAAAAEAQAQAAEAESAAALPEAKARAAQAAAQVDQAEAEAGLAQLTLQRDQRMAQGDDHAVTPADLDAARSADAAAQARVRAARANVAALGAAVASAQAQDRVAHAQLQAAQAAVAAAQAAVRDAERELSYADIAAPAAGRIGGKNVEVGDRVQAGQTLMVVVEPEVWVVANFKETQLARMQPGQPVEVEIDAIPDRALQGTVESVAPASGAQFALLPPDNATGNFTKVVQRVPVKIRLDPADLQGLGDRVRPGLSAVVNVRVR